MSEVQSNMYIGLHIKDMLLQSEFNAT